MTSLEWACGVPLWLLVFEAFVFFSFFLLLFVFVFELIANNVDLLTEILLRLPPKSLLRFKSVSKRWLSLISHPQFSTNHSCQNPSPPISGLYFYRGNHLNSVSFHGHGNLPSLSLLDGLGGESKTIIEHSLNGLLLCSRFAPAYSFIVCNPTTQKYTVLSPPTWPSKLPRLARLAFDPSESPHYKVVSVCRDPYQIDVYSSHSACWRQVFVQDKCYGHGVFWNGAIHLLSDENALWRFDADAEKLITMPKPPTSCFLDKILYFGESVGSLILIQGSSYYPSGFRILEMDGDSNCWVVKRWFNLRPIEKIDFEFRVLCVVKGEEEKDFTLFVFALRGRIISYYRKCETWTVLRGLGRHELIDDDAYPFVETLFAF